MTIKIVKIVRWKVDKFFWESSFIYWLPSELPNLTVLVKEYWILKVAAFSFMPNPLIAFSTLQKTSSSPTIKSNQRSCPIGVHCIWSTVNPQVVYVAIAGSNYTVQIKWSCRFYRSFILKTVCQCSKGQCTKQRCRMWSRIDIMRVSEIFFCKHTLKKPRWLYSMIPNLLKWFVT